MSLLESAAGGIGTVLSSGLTGFLSGGKKGFSSMMASINGSRLTGAQREQNAFNASEAAIARDFGEMQRQTQYQTAVNDMIAAGLNPAMMYQGAGQAASATPAPAASGASPQSNKLSDIVAMFSAMAELQKVEAETKNIEAQTNFTNAQTDNMPGLWQSQIDINKSNIDVNNQKIQGIIQDMAESKSRVELNGKEMEVKDAQIALFGAQVSETEARKLLDDANRFLAEANESQIRALTPALVALNEANARLANQKSLTEVEQRFYLRKAALAQEACAALYRAEIPFYGSQTNLNRLEFDDRLLDYKSKSNLYDKTDGNYMYKQYRYDQNVKLWSTIGSLLSGGAALGNAAASFQRNSIMKG